MANSPPPKERNAKRDWGRATQDTNNRKLTISVIWATAISETTHIVKCCCAILLIDWICHFIIFVKLTKYFYDLEFQWDSSCRIHASWGFKQFNVCVINCQIRTLSIELFENTKKYKKVEFYLGHIGLHFKGEILRRVSNSLIYCLKTQKAVHLF